MSKRSKVTSAVETNVLIAARRRCCLCVFLNGKDEVCRGQLAHLDHDASDSRFENLVWLCLDHHDEYDSKTSQSKGFTTTEVKKYRDKLYAQHPEETRKAIEGSRVEESPELPSLPPRTDFDKVRKKFPKQLNYLSNGWRYPMWQVANKPDLFAFKSPNRADGICLIERIDLPDRRIVIACISVAGNPGISITNAVEAICFQVCERFEIPPKRLVWLEHYDDDDQEDWLMVTFANTPPRAQFSNPKWTTMTSDMWKDLRMRPKKRLMRKHGQYDSKLKKLFLWPTQNLVE